ncbi:oxalate:formate antiporter [Paraferrimonas sedimenticola]|uniref:Oxalate:formate antiporter n=2 Tax=Paraferrimonas sedimenticola TaxID=375674 RepID=A0AA37RX21_9GAMM|nr:oxalate:formate antiporter [Paraferrimonas sedimenticola]
MDNYSDLDLVIAVENDTFDSVMAQRFELLKQIPGYVSGFTGEHVGEPRLIVSIFEPNVIHVDFKFVAISDAAQRVDDTQVLWQRDNRLSDAYADSDYHYPQPDPQWIEDRFWIWVHYGATKIARGEAFEALEFLSFLRQQVLSPLALQQAGLTPSGVRTIQQRLPEFARSLEDTVATLERDSLVRAFKAAIDVYLSIRDESELILNPKAQQLCLEYFYQELER